MKPKVSIPNQLNVYSWRERYNPQTSLFLGLEFETFVFVSVKRAISVPDIKQEPRLERQCENMIHQSPRNACNPCLSDKYQHIILV